jgi:hypothetical protein
MSIIDKLTDKQIEDLRRKNCDLQRQVQRLRSQLRRQSASETNGPPTEVPLIRLGPGGVFVRDIYEI